MFGTMFLDDRLGDLKDLLRSEIRIAQAESRIATVKDIAALQESLSRLEAKVDRERRELLAKIADLERALKHAHSHHDPAEPPVPTTQPHPNHTPV